MTYAVDVIVTLTAMTCPVQGCGVTYGLDEEIRQRRLNDKRVWYCTNGHDLHYPAGSSGSDAAKLRQAESELTAARRIAANERELRQSAERQRSAARGQVTKIKRRVRRGVCPCCNRTFADLGRHMAGQHPEFANSES